MIFFTGFLVGVVSLIPGISGGTILVLTKKYELIANAITHFKEKENRLTLAIFLLGIFMGCLSFARIIEFLFFFFPKETILFFCGFLCFSIPDFIKSENIKLSFGWFFLGALLIYFLSCFSTPTPVVILEYPKITLFFLIVFMLCGLLDGFFTILPGISGSMMMMLLGPYFLYKSYLANLSFKTLIFLIPLLFYFIGDLLGFFLGSRFSLYCIKKHHKSFMSFLLGMIIMSILVLIPFSSFTFDSLIPYAILLLTSFILYQFLNLMQ